MEMKMTNQGKITAVAQALIVIAILLPFSPMAKGLGLGQRIITALVYSAVSVLIVYNTNCLERGNCTIWAYVVAILTLIGAIGTVTGTVASGVQMGVQPGMQQSMQPKM
jgi:hypothetical protein